MIGYAFEIGRVGRAAFRLERMEEQINFTGRLKEINRYINIRLAKAICQRFRSFSSSLVFGIGPEKSFEAIWPCFRAFVILGIIVTEGGHQFLPLHR